MTSKERIIQLTDQNDDEFLPYLLLQAAQLFSAYSILRMLEAANI